MGKMFRFEKTRFWLLLVFVITVVICLLSMSWRDAGRDILAWRWQALLFTGVTAWLLMTLCVVISAAGGG